MPAESEGEDYEKLAQRELDLAASTSDPITKSAHLNKAAHYATLRERAAEPRARLSLFKEK